MQTARNMLDNRRGAIIIWFALFLLLTLGIVSIGIDVAKLAATRTQLQNAADAAALAGASAINPATGTIVQATAITRAQQTALQNKAFINTPQPVVVDAADVTFPTADRVQVTTRREGDNSIVTHFAQVLGITRLQMKATAVAKVDTARSIDCGIVPLAIWPDPGVTYQVGCMPGYTLKLASPGTPGNFGPIDYPACTNGPCSGLSPTGANTFRCLMAKGYCCPIPETLVLQTEPGNMSGPFKQAIDDRFSQDTDRRIGICYSQYTGNGRRIVFVPITTPPVAGRTDVTVLSFGAFFLKDRAGSGTNSSLVGEFIYAVAPGSIDNNGSPNGPIVYTIRLVQ